MAQLIIDGREQSVTSIVTFNDETGNLYTLFGRPDPRYRDRSGKSLQGELLPVRDAKFIGGKVEDDISDDDIKRAEEFTAITKFIHPSLEDLDPRIIANGLKELEEESSLVPEVFMDPYDGAVRLGHTLTRNGGMTEEQDIHYLNIHLGTLSDEDIDLLRDQIAPKDDMLRTIIMPVHALYADDDDTLSFKDRDGFVQTKTDFDGFPELDHWDHEFDTVINSLRNKIGDLGKDEDKHRDEIQKLEGKIATLLAEQQNFHDMHNTLRGMDGIDQTTLEPDFVTTLFRPRGSTFLTDSQIFIRVMKNYFGIAFPHVTYDTVPDIIRKVAREHVIDHRGDQTRASMKSRESVVTESDLAAEKALDWELRHVFPDIRVIGEEGVDMGTASIKHLDDDGYVFVLDPIDGTKEYAAGGDRYNMMVALRVDGETVASWIYFPESDEMYYALKGRGIFYDDGNNVVKMDCEAPVHGVKNMTLLHGAEKTYKLDSPEYQRLKDTFNDVVLSNRIAGFDFLQILEGKVDALIYGQAKFNDVMPWQPFLREMGYVMTDLDGLEYDPQHPKRGAIIAPDIDTASHVTSALGRG